MTNPIQADMSISEPILVVYCELPKLTVTSELRQARVDESPNLRIVT